MKVNLTVSEGKSSGFHIELKPENEVELAALKKMSTAGRYSVSFCGHEYMEPGFKFYGFIPSND